MLRKSFNLYAGIYLQNCKLTITYKLLHMAYFSSRLGVGFMGIFCRRFYPNPD